LIDGDERFPAARVHLLWQPWDWLDSKEILDFAMDQFKRGAFVAFLDGRAMGLTDVFCDL
jgi:hypothetical protein